AAGLPPEALKTLTGFSGAVFWGGDDAARAYDVALAERDGPILPLVTEALDRARVVLERHLCVDTTASGGNAELLAQVASAS
ncbi:MAG: hypothetical protein WCD16_02495, partial [Paracoccaceae bacterium]